MDVLFISFPLPLYPLLSIISLTYDHECQPSHDQSTLSHIISHAYLCFRGLNGVPHGGAQGREAERGEQIVVAPLGLVDEMAVKLME